MLQALPCHRFILRRNAFAIIIPKTRVQYRSRNSKCNKNRPAMPLGSGLPRTMCEIKAGRKSGAVEDFATKNREIDSEFFIR